MACLRLLSRWLRKSWSILMCRGDGSNKVKNSSKVKPHEPQYYFELADETPQIDFTSLPPREHVQPSTSEKDVEFVYANESCDKLKSNALKIIQLDGIRNQVGYMSKKLTTDSKKWDHCNNALDDLAGYKKAQRDISQVRKAILNDDIRRSHNFRRIQKANGIERYGPHTSDEEFTSDLDEEQKDDATSEITFDKGRKNENKDLTSFGNHSKTRDQSEKNVSQKSIQKEFLQHDKPGNSSQAENKSEDDLLPVGKESYVSVVLLDENEMLEQLEGSCSSNSSSGIGTDKELNESEELKEDVDEDDNNIDIDSRLQNALKHSRSLMVSPRNKRTRNNYHRDGLNDATRNKEEGISTSSYELDKKKRKYCDNFEIPTPPELKEDFYQLPYVQGALTYRQAKKTAGQKYNTMIAGYDHNKNLKVTINSYKVRKDTKWRRWRLGNSQSTWPY